MSTTEALPKRVKRGGVDLHVESGSHVTWNDQGLSRLHQHERDSFSIHSLASGARTHTGVAGGGLYADEDGNVIQIDEDGASRILGSVEDGSDTHVALLVKPDELPGSPTAAGPQMDAASVSVPAGDLSQYATKTELAEVKDLLGQILARLTPKKG